MSRNIQNIVNSIVTNSIEFALQDESWKKFGYSKRPKYGEWINKFFRKKWKVDLEKRILIELLSMAIATLIRFNYEEFRDQNFLISSIAEKLSENNLWRIFDFDSKNECYKAFSENISGYLSEKTKDWHTLFLDNIGIESIPNEELKANVLMGAIRLSQTHDYM